jgi:hypothetical protein
MPPILATRKSNLKNTPDLDIKLFAHIHNDTRLLGTTLQGDTFQRTTNYIVQTMKYMAEEDCGINPEKRLRIEKVIEKTSESFKVLSAIDNECNILINKWNHSGLSYTETDIDNSIAFISHNIAEKVNLSGSVLMPGGWSGEPGHAMAYKFIKKDGGFTFLIFNTGEGLGYHAPSETSRDEHLPVMAYDIPQCSQEDLSRFIQELLNPQIKPSLTYIQQDGVKRAQNTFDGTKSMVKLLVKLLF